MVLSSSNRKYQPHLLLSFLPLWLCAWDVCYIVSCHLSHIHSGKTGILFYLLLRSLWWGQKVGYFWLADRIRLYSFDLAYSFSYPLYNIWGCVFSVYPFPLWWFREYILCLIIISRSEVWTSIHCLGLGHGTMVCAVCLYKFFFIFLRILLRKGIICRKGSYTLKGYQIWWSYPDE